MGLFAIREGPRAIDHTGLALSPESTGINIRDYGVGSRGGGGLSVRMVMNVYVSYVVQGDTNPEPQVRNFLGTSDINQNGYFQSAALGNLILS